LKNIAGMSGTGSPEALIELVEYGDFQCLRCLHAHQSVRFLQDILGDQLNFIFRHFPRPKDNPLALEAAIAAEAAGQQGSFWDMHDLLFEKQSTCTRNSFVLFAEELGLDIAQFQQSSRHDRVIEKIIKDFELGVRSGVKQTPVFFINGVRHQDPFDFDSLYRACAMQLEVPTAPTSPFPSW
jgi:protein-disulfide isomerase